MKFLWFKILTKNFKNDKEKKYYFHRNKESLETEIYLLLMSDLILTLIFILLTIVTDKSYIFEGAIVNGLCIPFFLLGLNTLKINEKEYQKNKLKQMFNYEDNNINIEEEILKQVETDVEEEKKEQVVRNNVNHRFIACNQTQGLSLKNQLSRNLKTLELPATTRDTTIIKKQYRDLMKQYHQDKIKDGGIKATEINVAYEQVLKILSHL